MKNRCSTAYVKRVAKGRLVSALERKLAQDLLEARAALAAIQAKKAVLVPVEPSKEMLDGMATATFLSDRSNLEMHRRFNGLLDVVRKEPME
jgi:hypothetical protein